MATPIIQFFVTLRNAVKVYHWATLSYPRHKATDQFVTNIDKLTDSFIEIYIGKYGRGDVIGKKDIILTLPALDENAILKYFKDARIWLSKNLREHLSESDTDLLNIRDEIRGEINQALYLFTLS